MKYTYIVNDMACGHCKMHIEKALKALEGVESFNVDLKTKKVEVQTSLNPGLIEGAIRDAGYTPEKV
jgi:copper chaperone CopZ